MDTFSIPLKEETIPVRQGYRSFLGLIIMLWKNNRSLRDLGVKVKYEVILPIPWK